MSRSFVLAFVRVRRSKESLRLLQAGAVLLVVEDSSFVEFVLLYATVEDPEEAHTRHQMKLEMAYQALWVVCHRPVTKSQMWTSEQRLVAL